MILGTNWEGRGVIGMSDCLWGLLDGVNDAGFGVSLAFGGRPVTGEGFGVPLVLRYLLQVCETVADAREVLARLPYQLAHTLTMADRSGGVLTAYLAPDRAVEFREVSAATNHQGAVEWTEHAAATRSLEREHCMTALLRRPRDRRSRSSSRRSSSRRFGAAPTRRDSARCTPRCTTCRRLGDLRLARLIVEFRVRRFPRGSPRRALPRGLRSVAVGTDLTR